ncbi:MULTISPECIES: ATP-binding protein [unclassified Streptomyces]|uniref:ATP-binding protein n=1 Tax=unclassified Streptomyces TaxID=2593676 RepID=UPI0035DCB529
MSPLPVALDLLAVPKAVPEVRRTLRERCGGADSPDLLLCVSELLTNAIVHLGEGTPVTLRVSGTCTGRVRVELSDPEPGAWPVIRSAAGGDESGRGLALVDALALRWGVEQGPRGKTVWCELRVPGPSVGPSSDEGRTDGTGQRRVSEVSDSTRVSFSGLRT